MQQTYQVAQQDQQKMAAYGIPLFTFFCLFVSCTIFVLPHTNFDYLTQIGIKVLTRMPAYNGQWSITDAIKFPQKYNEMEKMIFMIFIRILPGSVPYVIGRNTSLLHSPGAMHSCTCQAAFQKGGPGSTKDFILCWVGYVSLGPRGIARNNKRKASLSSGASPSAFSVTSVWLPMNVRKIYTIQ